MNRVAAVAQSSFWRSFGPGLMWAAAAIGVSHLHQSTRAGANAGFALTGVILLALLLKYPFFEYGPRYAAATGESLVEGYLRIGRWALWLYLILTIVTSLIIQTAVILFTSFLLKFVFRIDWSIAVIGGIVCSACGLLLWVGRFRTLDVVVKVIVALLVLSTLAAAAVTLPRADLSTFDLGIGAVLDRTVGFAFLLALVGWMPSAIDIAVWSSLWTLAKDRTAGIRTTVSRARLDFLVGYVGTGVLAYAFLMLGATVMFQSRETFSPQGMVFSTQLVELYSRTLGDWTRTIVEVAVLTTMLSTALTVVDGFPRAIDRSVKVLFSPGSTLQFDESRMGRPYWISLVALAALTVVVLAVFIGNLATMIDFATIMSFITAPVLGYLNLRAVTSPEVAEEDRPGPALLSLSYVGLILLGGTGVVYIVSRFT